MSQTVVPMIDVPDVRATVDWYTSIGFSLDRQNEEDGEINWAKLTFGNSEVMFQSGGKASTEHRREVDLYITTENVDEVYRRFKDRVQIVEDPHEPAPGSPQGRHGFFLEHRRRAGVIGEVDGSQEGLGLWIVRRGDASAFPLRPIPSVSSTGAVAPTVSVGRSHASGASSAPAAALSPPTLPSLRPPSPSANPTGEPPGTASACLLRIHSLGEGDGVLTGVPRGFALRARLLRLLRLGHSSHRSRLSRLRPRRDYSDPWNPCYRSCRPNHRCRSYRWNRCCRRNSR